MRVRLVSCQLFRFRWQQAAQTVAFRADTSTVSAAPFPIIESLGQNPCQILATLRSRGVTYLQLTTSEVHMSAISGRLRCTIVAVSATDARSIWCIRRLPRLRACTGRALCIHGVHARTWNWSEMVTERRELTEFCTCADSAWPHTWPELPRQGL